MGAENDPRVEHFLSRRSRVILTVAAAATAGVVSVALLSMPQRINDARSVKDDVSQSVVATGSANLLAEKWTMPGTSQDANGLHITRTGLAIVEQDGSGGQPNPPVELAGPHLNVSGDFKIGATASDTPGASLQFYGSPPIIQDEFRVETPSVRMSLQDNHTLAVALWDGQPPKDLSNPAPDAQRTFTFTPRNNIGLTLTRQDGQLLFGVNGQTVGQLPEQGVFRTGTVWFGADAGNSKGAWQISKLTAEKLGGRGGLSVVIGSSLKIHKYDPTGLQVLATAKRPKFLIGAAVDNGPLFSDPAYDSILLGDNFGSYTATNIMKPQFLEPQEGVFTFGPADDMIELARQNGIDTIHGHTLVFSEALPAWMRNSPPQRVQPIMLDYIAKVAGHFKGRVASWDVVNEPLADYDQFDPASGKIFRDNIWKAAMGDGYIATALKAAHQADPSAKLFINEFGLLEPGERQDAMVALVRQLKAQGVTLDGIGLQMHVYEKGDQVKLDQVQAAIKRFADLGLDVRISEVDVYSDDGQQVQAEQYATGLKACLSVAACKSYTLWIPTDKYNYWQDDQHQLQYGKDAPWDAAGRPTPVVAAIKQVLK